MVEGRNEENSIGFIHLISFTLLVLSGERLFGIQLNKPFNLPQWSRNLPPFKGNFNDFLILVRFSSFLLFYFYLFIIY